MKDFRYWGSRSWQIWVGGQLGHHSKFQDRQSFKITKNKTKQTTTLKYSFLHYTKPNLSRCEEFEAWTTSQVTDQQLERSWVREDIVLDSSSFCILKTDLESFPWTLLTLSCTMILTLEMDRSIPWTQVSYLQLDIWTLLINLEGKQHKVLQNNKLNKREKRGR